MSPANFLYRKLSVNTWWPVAGTARVSWWRALSRWILLSWVPWGSSVTNLLITPGLKYTKLADSLVQDLQIGLTWSHVAWWVLARVVASVLRSELVVLFPKLVRVMGHCAALLGTCETAFLK